jgi:glyoxylase-like metal-dependent hydrolase (beta-lactamase superfamily II)
MKRLFILFMAIQGIALGQQNFDTVKIQSVKVKENIYMLKGSGGNMGLLTGKDGSLLIDDQFAPLSEKIKAAAQSLDSNPIKYLINTHIHGDHTGGNDNFQKMGVTILAQEHVRDRMMMEQVNKAMNRTTPARDAAALPVITFDDRIRLHLNGEDIEVFHFNEGSHTDGDAIIHFTKSNVFHTGDVFVRYGYPFIDYSSGGSVNGFVNVLDKLLVVLNDQSVIIPGHGELATKADVKKFRDRMAEIRDQVAAAIKKGKKPADIPALGITDKYDAEWGKGFLKGKDFVLMIAEELAKGKK